MKCTGFTGWSRVLLAVLALAVAAPVTAQDGGEASLAEIEMIEAAARHLAADADWDRAAALLRRAAELRPVGDAAAVRNLLRAGRLAFYEGHEEQAVRDFEAAGRRALDRGDVIASANAFTDGAWVAKADGRPAKANELLARAQMLAQSPLLGRDDRAHLWTRWGGGTQ